MRFVDSSTRCYPLSISGGDRGAQKAIEVKTPSAVDLAECVVEREREKGQDEASPRTRLLRFGFGG